MKLRLTYLLLLAITITHLSCDKQLSEPPRNARVEGTAITDEKTARISLNGVYYRLAGVNSNNVTYWLNHQMTGGMHTGMLGYAYGSFRDEFNENQNSQFSGGLWDENYQLLNAANGVIRGINAVSDHMFTGNRKNELLAESRFLRAYAHFKLLIYFAEWYKPGSPYGVLLRNELSTLSNIPKARSSVADSYQFILDDLDYAIANGPAANPAYYATKWTAMALKMRVLMSRGGQNDYTVVIDLANTVGQSGSYALENNLKDLFYVKGLNSKEVILGIKPQPNQEVFRYILSRQYYPGASGLYVAKQGFKDLFRNDPREAWMVGPLVPRAQATSPGARYFTKYIPYEGTPSQTTETSYAFRLTEVYLLQAEAIIRSGGSLPAAKTLIKTVMAKAGVSDFTVIDNASTPEELLLQNYYEILRNLTGEDGIEWMALLRLPFNTVRQLKPTITSQKQYILPIPLIEFLQNPVIGDQNPGYDR
ncbi:RagB/SusD family nutrient uptake outer membrane protein [Chitinophaga sp. 212800010-3]|uniref:RagB/SusD family nutrient uptake outer membrane protein n=1 Tax=unclassified Chitinophaga TaxID=2619133 RepID=UPI002DF3F4E0|nr:SusD family protein [Chitinophaga sp. 212800010-3]